jgi:hypothetical protein
VITAPPLDPEPDAATADLLKELELESHYSAAMHAYERKIADRVPDEVAEAQTEAAMLAYNEGDYEACKECGRYMQRRHFMCEVCLWLEKDMTPDEWAEYQSHRKWRCSE